MLLYQLKSKKSMKKDNNSTIETLQKEVNLLTKNIEEIRELVNRYNWQLQNCIRFYLAGKQIGFKMWQMNIPAIGEFVEIRYFVDDENYDYVSGFFNNRKSKKINGNDSLSDYFSFSVESVLCQFTDNEDLDNDSGCDYNVYLTPNVKTDKISQ
jgi:hypothetical protein